MADKTLEQMQAEVVEVNVRHDRGNGEPVPFQTAVANLHGEVSEAWEAWRKWGLDDATGPIRGLGYQRTLPKPEGVGSEFADIFIRLLDNCAAYGVDLRAEYERKVAYNRMHPHTEQETTKVEERPDDDPVPVATCNGRDCGGRPHE